MEQYAAQLKQILPASDAFVNIADVIATVYDTSSNHAVVVLPIDQLHANMKSGLAAKRAFEAAGISFTILFEDEMNDHVLLSAKLNHYIQSSQTHRIHARQCEIRMCDKDETKALLDTHTIFRVLIWHKYLMVHITTTD